MSEQKSIKVGDRVRFIKDYNSEYVCADKGDCGTIVAVDRDFYTVNLDSPEQIYVHRSGIERVELIDPKTAFLSELKGLLAKYDVKIEVAMSTIQTPCLDFTIGNEAISYYPEGCLEDDLDFISVSADNIMDYDKE